jgi:hypothetical protein
MMKSPRYKEASIVKNYLITEMVDRKRIETPDAFVIPVSSGHVNGSSDLTQPPLYQRLELHERHIAPEDAGTESKLSSRERKALLSLYLNSDPAFSTFWQEFALETGQTSISAFYSWEPRRRLTKKEQAMLRCNLVTVVKHSRLRINHLVFRTRESEKHLVTADCGIAVQSLVDGHAVTRYGKAEFFATHQLYKHNDCPATVIVRGVWYGGPTMHASGLELVTTAKNNPVRRRLRTTPLVFASSVIPEHVVFWSCPALRSTERFVIRMDEDMIVPHD